MQEEFLWNSEFLQSQEDKSMLSGDSYTETNFNRRGSTNLMFDLVRRLSIILIQTEQENLIISHINAKRGCDTITYF
jgi:hypothetical protein